MATARVTRRMNRTTRRRELGAIAIVAALMVLCAPGEQRAAAAPASRAAALAAWQATTGDVQVPSGWTGSTSGCVIGAESAASVAATLRTANTLRDFAGLGPVRFDLALNHKALAAALMMQAAGNLSHSPGPTWPCYSAEGAEGAGRSNLFGGQSGAAAMIGYVDDGGVGSLGHRRWLLDPQAATFGTGSTGTYNALLVIGDGGIPAQPAPAGVAWPPPGWVPWQWVFENWSITIGGDGQPSGFSSPTVSVAVNGAPVAVDSVENLGSGYGTGTTLKWRVVLNDDLRRADARIDVAITGATRNGAPLPITYTVSAFQPVPPDIAIFAGSPQSLRVSRSGRFSYGFIATPGRSGKAKLTSTSSIKVGARKRKVKLAAKSFTAPSNAKVKVKFKLSARNLRALKHRSSLKFKVSVTVGQKHFTTKLTLKPPKKG